METSSLILIYGTLIGLGTVGVFLGGFFLSQSMQKNALIPLKESLEEAENDRDEATQRFQDLTNNLAAAVIVRNQHGEITYCSPFTEVLTGYPLSEIYESEQDFFLRICHESEKERLFRSFKITELGGEPFHFTFQFYHKSGIRMWAETRTVPILDDNDEVSATLSITMDVTASMLHQRQIEEKNRELKDFTYMVSHDLKAPIFTIRGMLSVVQEDFQGELSPGLDEILMHISNASIRLEKLVASVLEYSKIGSQELMLEPVALDEVFTEVLQDHQHLMEAKNAEILRGDLPTVIGDKLCLSQVFSNLIGNALKYCHPDRPPRITVEGSKRGIPHIVDISVTDNGLGIPSDRLDGIFRPFTRLHGEEIEGTGIGLASVRKLVDKQGGQVAVTSTIGEGSTFVVSLRTEET